MTDTNTTNTTNTAIAAKGFDLSAALNAPAQQITFDVPVIFDADGEPVSGFKIVGKNSPEYQAAAEALRIEGIKRSARRKTAIDTATDAGAVTWAKLVAGNEKKLASAVVVGWFGFDNAGVPLEFDKQVVDAALTKFPTWREKISAAIENDANFIKP